MTVEDLWNECKECQGGGVTYSGKHDSDMFTCLACKGRGSRPSDLGYAIIALLDWRAQRGS